MATDADIDPKTFRQALRDANLSWPEPDTGWRVTHDSPQYNDMKQVLLKLLAKQK
jgi:hypothetical protein